MGKLEELRQIVAQMFNNAEDKQAIEQLATLNNSISEVEKEHNTLVEKNAELIKSYKDLVQHTSFNTGTQPSNDPAGTAPVSFEDALKEFMSKNK